MDREEKMKEFILEFWQFLKERKIWWIAPIVIVLVIFGLLLFFVESSPVAPFIYTLF